MFKSYDEAREAAMRSGSGPDCMSSNPDSTSASYMTFFGQLLNTSKSQFPYM